MTIYNELTGLPYPYEIYNVNTSIGSSPSDYVNIVRGWVEKNTVKKLDIKSKLQQMFRMVEKTDENREIIRSLVYHKDKIRYMVDLSGMAFAVIVDEEKESFIFRFPHPDGMYSNFYNDYDGDKFMGFDAIEKINWLAEYCEFIPVTTFYENFDTCDDHSHKFSHIKKDAYTMGLLKPWLDQLDYPPSDNVYYLIKFNSSGEEYNWYLKRDINASPKV